MSQNDTPRPGDVLMALRLLSRLPLAAETSPPRPAAAWAWPLAGAVIGLLSGLSGWAALGFGPAVAAAVALGAQAMLTGAMHEDGLADTADGLWGGWDKKRRLEIMKDSHIGTYGVMVLLIVGLIRWSALTALLANGQWWGLIVVGAVSRVPMTVLLAVMPNARGAGLSQSVGRIPPTSAWLALACGLAFALYWGLSGLWIVLAIAVVSGILALIARAKIGGQTGDILGASQQLSEAAGLCVLAAQL
jgi:adenosylcobinamide-GDP ribazoletransferase